MVKVKICGVTRASDARFAVQAGAAAIGLNFFPNSPRFVSLATARAIRACVPAGVWAVGVFVDAEREEVARTADELDLDALQFHGNEPPEYCRGWKRLTIKALRVKERGTLESIARYATDLVLLDAYVVGVPGGTGKCIPLEWLDTVAKDRLILAGGLTPANVGEAVRSVRPFAVDVASGVESAPGIKDFRKVKEFIAHATTA